MRLSRNAFLRTGLVGIAAALRGASSAHAVSGWPDGVEEIRYRNTADKSLQPALYFTPKPSSAVPLLVGCHTWSSDYLQSMSVPYATWCIENDWAFIHPHFRGPNNNPQAAGSALVVSDILSAVEWACASRAIDRSRIYLVGVSGGGMASLLMAGRAPDVWAGVSSWASISDLAAWYRERKGPNDSHHRLWLDMHAALGGDPATDPAAAEEAYLRSPLTYMANARGIPVDISTGIHDGHTGSVSVSHSIRAFNALASKADRIADKDITFMVARERVPDHLRFDGSDPLYGEKGVLLRRESGRARLTLFEGGHEIIFPAALKWLAAQKRAVTS